MILSDFNSIIVLILYLYLTSTRLQKRRFPNSQKQYAPSNMPANVKQTCKHRSCSLMWHQLCTTIVLGSPVCPDIQIPHHLASLTTGLSTVDVSVSADSSALYDLGSASLYHTREAILSTQRKPHLSMHLPTDLLIRDTTGPPAAAT